MTCTRAELIDEALSWVGTPYRTHQSCKGAGADCGGFCYGVWRNVGLLPANALPQRLSSQWYLHRTDEIIVRGLQAHGAVEIPLDEAKPGDVLTFQYGRAQSHMAFLLPRDRIVHSYAYKNVICIDQLETLMPKFRKAWLVPGLLDD
jgi:NlpC/P60 family putative phage cell wall peptidase